VDGSNVPTEVVDVVIVGAGVVGTAIARELSHYDLSIHLIDAANDVGARTSKANTAILHTGFDATPGTLESRLVQRGYHLLDDYATTSGIAVERIGALLVAWDDEQLDALDGLAAKAVKNGYDGTSRVGADELYDLEPHLGPGALGALRVPGESIICPWSTTLAFATQAVRAGVTLRLETRVEHVEVCGDTVNVRTDHGDVVTRVLINAAGLFSDVIDHDLGHDGFHVTPRRGQLLVYDKMARSLVHHILLPVPSRLGKGVLVAPTVYGNVLLGPTAEDLDDKGATESTAEGISFLLDKGARIMPSLLDEEVSAVYAGLRAATEHADYQIVAHCDQHYVCVGGIRSTGLTASMAIAEYVAGLVTECGLGLGARRELEPVTVPMLGQTFDRPYQRADLIDRDPLYGDIVCHCERVTHGEIRDAFESDLAPRGLDGLRRRTRAMNGRCQGFYCGAALEALVDEIRGTSST
jgi:glycerol-3-phosphate dehydrogenase